ncbi:hypothetical protein HF526_09515 [Pseudonocardia sp. K10HN5]|uniref:Uncharacterized protein n=1 Tax=Pseudonocardia acidicola TaxID=2724939 RepID=A0ABX1SAP3_9PSEU|nr:hypothetical protein [Pseudonocardia acidicola]
MPDRWAAAHRRPDACGGTGRSARPVPGVGAVAGEPGPGPAEHFEHRFRPISAGVAVPIFAFFAAGVSVAAAGGSGAVLGDPVAPGVIAGLAAGEPVGVLGATWLVQRFTRAQLAEGLSWCDVLGLALLAGIGFTVSLLIGELAFGAGSERDDHVKIGVLLGSLLAALPATVVQVDDHPLEPLHVGAEQIDGVLRGRRELVTTSVQYRHGVDHRGEGRAELVADVAGEAGVATHPLLEGRRVPIERRRQRREVGVVVLGQPCLQVPGRDPPRGRGQVGQRAQRATARPPPEAETQQRAGGDPGDQHRAEETEVAVELEQREQLDIQRLSALNR